MPGALQNTLRAGKMRRDVGQVRQHRGGQGSSTVFEDGVSMPRSVRAPTRLTVGFSNIVSLAPPPLLERVTLPCA